MEPDPPARVPARLVLASIAGAWLCYFLLASLRGAVAGFDFSLPMLSRRLIVTLAAMALTAVLVWPVLRALDSRPLWVRALAVLLVALPASVGIAGINQWAFADIESEVIAKIGEKEGIKIRKDEAGNVLVDVPGETGLSEADAVLLDTNRWRQISDLALGRYFVLLAWAALYLAFANAEQARAAERREGEYRRAAKAAELRSLRYQVNPHFLFNTLNSLSALVMTGKGERAERMIQSLSSFYRHSLTDDPTKDVALRDEFDLQRHYLEIEAVRFPDRLRAHFELPKALEPACVPGMILQPLIENSVKHAVAPSKGLVTLTIAAREEDGQLVLEVSDDGGGPAGSLAGHGIGLANVRQRLEARFGSAASLGSGPTGSGYATLIRIPLNLEQCTP